MPACPGSSSAGLAGLAPAPFGWLARELAGQKLGRWATVAHGSRAFDVASDDWNVSFGVAGGPGAPRRRSGRREAYSTNAADSRLHCQTFGKPTSGPR